MTHQGGPPKWNVLKDASAPRQPNVLAQVSNDRTAGRFPVASWDGLTWEDGTLSVKYQAVSGALDYEVRNGERISLARRGTVSNAYGLKHRVPKQTRPSLSVGFHGHLFTVSVDNERLFEVEDSTFTGAGKRAYGVSRIASTWMSTR